MLLVSGLADLLPLNGITTAEINARIKVYFFPSYNFFYIWGLIFLLLVCFTVYQALPSQRETPALRKIGWWYVLTCLANSAWVLCRQYQLALLSLGMMSLLLYSLDMIYKELEIGLIKIDSGRRFFVNLPFSIYVGWITILMISNISIVLDSLGWKGFGLDDQVWAMIMLVLSVLLAELITYNRQDLACLAVFGWSFIGIAQRAPVNSSVYIAAYLAALAVVVMALVSTAVYLKKRRRKKRLQILNE